MYISYVIVSILAAAANGYAATNAFTRNPKFMATVEKLSIPRALLPVLGILKALGAVGLIAGLFISDLSEITASCLIIFFLAAIVTHLRAGDYAIGGAAFFLLIAVAVLALPLAL